MKKSIRILAMILVICLSLGVGALAADGYTRELIANYVGVKLVVDGVNITPKDANGNVVDPFIVDGTTYLPVRAVAEALGKDVNWDGDTKTVYIGTKPQIDVSTGYDSFLLPDGSQVTYESGPFRLTSGNHIQDISSVNISFSKTNTDNRYIISCTVIGTVTGYNYVDFSLNYYDKDDILIGSDRFYQSGVAQGEKFKLTQEKRNMPADTVFIKFSYK